MPPILFGSHIDSVPEGGNYDGDVGSISAIEVAQVFAENNYQTRHPIEVIIFQNEEGGLIGSRAISGCCAGGPFIEHSGQCQITEAGGGLAQLVSISSATSKAPPQTHPR
jgi:hypothetical protein